MARGGKASEGRAARSERGSMFVPEVKNLYPASKLAPEEKEPTAYNTAQMIMRQTEQGKKANPSDPLYIYAQDEEDRGEVLGGKYDGNAMAYANQLSKEMTNGDRSNGLEDYFPKGMSTGFINALAKSGYTPGFNDPDTIAAVAKIIDARVKDEAAGGSRDFGGNWGVRAVKDPDGFRLEVYTEDYTGRGSDGEKTYRSSDTKEIAFIPHDEVSSKKFLTSPEEIYNSKSFIKAQALKGYLDALLMTSDF